MGSEKKPENVAPTGMVKPTSEAPIETGKRGRGRPPKDPNAPPKEHAESGWNVKLGLFLLSLGAKVEVLNRAVDNSRAISMITIKDEMFMLVEKEGRAILFFDGAGCERSGRAILQKLEERGINF